MLRRLADHVLKSRRCVVLTGAGFSAESGVPTFRGKEGLWGKFRPEELATMDAFMANPEIVWEWYNWRRDLMGEVKPNAGHYALAELENILDDFTLITQNVDGLHRVAGSKDVLELHGNIYHNKCLDCNSPSVEGLDIDPENIPLCEKCGGKLRPDVVWFGEMLNPSVIDRAFQLSEGADLFLSIGTSAVIHPAASLPIAAKKAAALLVEINPEETPVTSFADLRFSEKSGALLGELIELVRERKAAGHSEPEA